MAEVVVAKQASGAHNGWTENIEEELGHVANQEEHEMTALQAIARWPKVFGWCVFALFATLLVSFENQAAGNVLSIPKFREDFGHYYEGSYVLYTSWQSAFYGGPLAATIISTLCASAVSDRFGRKPTLIGAVLVSFAAIALEFVATTNPQFFGGKFLNGFTTGIIWSVSMSYVGELAPLPLRGLLTCLTAMMFTIGPLVAAIIVYFTGTHETRWAYRSVFVSQWGFAGITAIFMWFMPESYIWLVNVGRIEDAGRALRRMGHSDIEVTKKVSQAQLTLELSKQDTEGVTYLECFRKSNVRRTIISIMPMAIQALCGIYFVGSYSTYYIQLTGVGTEESFALQIVQQCLSMLGNIGSWYLVERVGRRSLTFWGLVGTTAMNFLYGGLGSSWSNLPALKGSFGVMLAYTFFYNLSIGATAFTILTEVSTSRLRAKTISMGIALQYVIYTVWAFVLPIIFNPDQGNLGGKTAFIFGGFGILCCIYVWFYQVETAGRSYEELDELFQKGVPVREFATYVTDVQTRSKEVTGSKAMDL